MGQVRLRINPPKKPPPLRNPGYVPVLHHGSVNAEKASPMQNFTI